MKGMTLDGVNCMSVLSYAATTASISATADRNLLQTYANGGSTKGILTNDGGFRAMERCRQTSCRWPPTV